MFKKTASEFKAFIMRGSVIDLAIGIIIGGAFGKIVSSLIADIIMPPIGLVINNIDFKDIKIHIGGTIDKPVYLGLGNFIQITVEFLIIAFVVFLIIKAVNTLNRKKEEASAAAPVPTGEEKLLGEIRDILKSK